MNLICSLLLGIALSASAAQPPPVPGAVQPPTIHDLKAGGPLAVTAPPKTNYVAVRASNAAGDSLWSNEVQVTNAATAVLSWSAPTNGSVTGYTLGYGATSGGYSNLVPVGTNTTSKLLIAKTNRVVTAFVLQGASPSGPWTIAPWAGTLSLTNPTGKGTFFKVGITDTNF